MKRIKIFIQNNIWEIVDYLTLALCIFGQITVGYTYLLAQIAYLIANIASVIRDYKLQLPRANKVKDVCFSAITITLITIWVI